MMTRLESSGVDVTELKSDLANGDTDAAKTWMENYRSTHKPSVVKGAGHPAGFDLSNVTFQQQMITKLESSGVDVTELKADLANGDTYAAKAWLQTYWSAHQRTHDNQTFQKR